MRLFTGHTAAAVGGNLWRWDFDGWGRAFPHHSQSFVRRTREKWLVQPQPRVTPQTRPRAKLLIRSTKSDGRLAQRLPKPTVLEQSEFSWCLWLYILQKAKLCVFRCAARRKAGHLFPSQYEIWRLKGAWVANSLQGIRLTGHAKDPCPVCTVLFRCCLRIET